jgi:hypothetical protein
MRCQDIENKIDEFARRVPANFVSCFVMGTVSDPPASPDFGRVWRILDEQAVL